MKVKKTTSAVISGAVLGLLLLVFLAAEVIVGETSVSYLYSIDSYGIHRQDDSTGSEKVIFSTEGMYGVSFSLSPSDTVIAVLITERGITPPGANVYSVPPRNSLLFIDLNGNEIAILDEDVRAFSWSPDGERIAYITGTYYEGGVGFKTTGVGIFGLRDGSNIPITLDFPHQTLRGYEGGGYEINWARHDSIIYVRDFGYLAGIYRYDTKVGKSEKVDLKFIDFSPDGKFYIGHMEEGNDFVRLFKTSTNTEITDQIRGTFGVGEELGEIYMDWVFGQGHLVHLLKYEYEFASESDRKLGKSTGRRVAYNVLYDVEKDVIVKEVTLPISRWTAGSGKLVFEKDGKFTVETYEDVCEK